jgi:thioredoxin 1
MNECNGDLHEVAIKALQKEPYFIRNIVSPTEQMCLEAVYANPEVIEYIEEPSEKVCFYKLRKDYINSIVKMNQPSTLHTNIETCSSRDFIENREGVRLIQFKASWCAPCRKVDPFVQELLRIIPPGIAFLSVDIDQDPEVYTLLRKRRLLVGIPSFVMYSADARLPHEPTHVVTGGNPKEVYHIFNEASKLTEHDAR